MPQISDILISVDQAYALKLLAGEKTAELRRRRLHVEPGTRVWIYSKLPRGQVELVATVDRVVAATPKQLWSTYRKRIAIPRSEFTAYLQGIEIACVVLFREVIPLQIALPLPALRRISRRFQPPQFFRRLVPRSRELKSFVSSTQPR